MKWLELSAQVPGEDTERVAAIVHTWVPGGIAFEYPVLPTVDEETALPDPTKQATLRFYLPLDETTLKIQRQIEESLCFPLQTREVEEDDWGEAWKAHFTTQRVGRRLVVKPTWEEYSPDAQAVVLELDPGLAFGTGLHPTTRRCLLELEKRLKDGDVILDLGTGSGILAIAAAKLGARSVLALDIDTDAVAAAKKNVKWNRVDRQVKVAQGSLGGHNKYPEFDLIVANLASRTILNLAEALAASLRAKGLLIASGISLPYLPSVQATVPLEIIAIVADGDWQTLVARKDAEKDAALLHT